MTNLTDETLAIATADRSEGLVALMAKLQPLIDGGRLDNLVDLLSLTSDMVDLLDAAMVEKLARLFENATAATWTVSNAVRMARAEVAAAPEPPGVYALIKLLNEPDTRKGVAVVLKTLNVIGRQL
ncbi:MULTISPECIES: DUF1641 domain-containing protein [unclassified Pseudomonas]|jgi:uncharacterized protein YjgD (DUF1641 family)|uniref:DUF1641 domain-containing protein n=1 Tax=unclassified Pseudomonas TaxID=196821 RepID=UPI000270AC70|nr:MULTISPECIES: DUF1641 domain-containing protein [unclassified Pseudomonas]EJM89044.1 hypothetical protein PMI33_02367 [Pseudomonas sp. GM67]MBD9547940.1 DUF1641 domain-containing protein [Pseudomonas sp. PDM01]